MIDGIGAPPKGLASWGARACVGAAAGAAACAIIGAWADTAPARDEGDARRAAGFVTGRAAGWVVGWVDSFVDAFATAFVADRLVARPPVDGADGTRAVGGAAGADLPVERDALAGAATRAPLRVAMPWSPRRVGTPWTAHAWECRARTDCVFSRADRINARARLGPLWRGGCSTVKQRTRTVTLCATAG
ncbi:MAG: hypothetical protein MUC68_07865 [Burkholderiaceae bacterium]|nr:hypothetical protein [Burkholderiaceae bacterium]